MKTGLYYYRGHTILITEDTKPSELEWIFKKYPEFKDRCGYNKKKRRNKSGGESESDESTNESNG